MPNYILLMTLTREGQEAVLRDADFIVEAASETHVQDVQGLGLYGVLGPYDFVSIIEAPDNDAAARYSIRLGVRAGAHITTLPAVPISLLHERDTADDSFLASGVELTPGDLPGVN